MKSLAARIPRLRIGRPLLLAALSWQLIASAPAAPLCLEPAGSPAATTPTSADEWAARARDRAKEGSMFEAIDAYDQAVAAAPSRIDIRLAYAALLKEALFWLRSAGQYRAVLSAEPGNVAALMGYGELLTAEYQFAAAAEQFSKVLQLGAEGTLRERAQVGLGTARFGMEDYENAARSFAAVLETQPESPTAMAYLAISKRKMGQLEESMKLWDRLLVLDPGAPPALIHRNEIEDLRATIDRARAAVQADPSNASAWQALGHALRAQPDLPGAEEALAAAVGLAPNLASAAFELGAVQRDRGRWGDAARGFQAAARDRRLGTLALYNLAWCRRRLADRGGEADAWREAVALHPDDAYAYERYARALKGLPAFDRERVSLSEKARGVRPPSAEATRLFVRLALLEAAGGSGEAARRAALDALRSDPMDVHAQRVMRDLVSLDAEALRQDLDRLAAPSARPEAALENARARGGLLLAMGREAEAEKEFRKVLAAAPNDARALVATASCLKPERGSEAILPMLESARRSEPGYLYAHLDLALALLEAGRADDAIAAARGAVDLDPDNPLGYSILGTAYRQNGDLERSALALEEAVALDPMDVSGAPRLMLAKVYGALGRTGRARETLIGDLPQDPDEIYRIVWEFVRDNYKDRTYHGQDWRAWRRRFEGRLRTPSQALGAVAMMLASLDDRNTRLRSADQTARLLFAERSGATEFGRSGVALSNSRTVETRHLQDGVGYIAITNLDDPKVATEVRKAVESVKTDDAVIVDLRGNQGGADHDVARIAGMFVKPGTETGTIVSPKGKVTVEAEPPAGQEGPILPKDKPVVVLVDRNTASSAENLAGSLKESNRAVLVGEKTYGKSGIQLPRLLPGGTIALVVVADRGDLEGAIYTGVGIRPDVAIDGEAVTDRSPDDPTMRRAREILRRRRPER